jgi:hypothetical protein
MHILITFRPEKDEPKKKTQKDRGKFRDKDGGKKKQTNKQLLK